VHTDKEEHGILAIYEERFAGWRERPVSYCEVGVFEGGSLEWASRFFANPDVRIVGLDIDLPQVTFEDQRISLIRCDQNDGRNLARVGVTVGPFDLIVDDGSHLARETTTTMTFLWPFLRPGGWYAIEDWNAGFTHHPMYRGMETVVTQIVRDQQNWGVSEMALLVTPNRQSIALFRKANR